ncbi:MAG: hypothetical protein KDA75_03580 [Planctomycetaceae bacterium]|nr:hypothetical protein [Planctomycetaceae bacterium]
MFSEVSPNQIHRIDSRPDWSRALQFLVAIILANAFLLLVAAGDRSWGALGIAVLIGPVTNGVIMLVAIISTVLANKHTGSRSTAVDISAAIVLPLLAVGVDFLLICGKGLHGC